MSRNSRINERRRNRPRYEVLRRQNHQIQIACIVCNRVFNSSQTLISHFQESHLRENGTFSRAQASPNPRPHQSEQQNQLGNSHQFVHSSPILSRETHEPNTQTERAHFFNPNHVQEDPSQVWRNYAARPSLSLGSSMVSSLAPRNGALCGEIESPSELTRPFINQLDQPISEVVVLVESDDDDDGLDLSLKL